MRYKKVLFVIPRSHAEWRGIRPHLGIGYLAEALVEEGIQYDIIDMNLGYRIKHIAEKINQFHPDLIGMPLISLEYLKFYQLLSWIRKEYENIPLIVGGPHVTIMKEKVLKDCSVIDFGVTFEGEVPLVELCKGEKEIKEIKNLLYRDVKDRSVIYNTEGEPNWELDKLSFPRYGQFELRKYVPEIPIYSSRGCPYNCIFCPNRLISPYYRARSAGHVVEEIEYWYKKGFRQFNFDDDNFNYDRQRVYEICDLVEKRGMKNLFLRCANGIRADKIDREMLKRMKKVGFHYIAFGADGGNNRILDIVKKGESIEQIESAVKEACELGYEVKLLFVVGTPYETKKDVADKIKLAQKYPLSDVHFYNIIPYPGTELFEWVAENNLFLIKPDEYLNDISCCEATPVFETPELPAEERIKLFKHLQRIRRNIHRISLRRIYKRFGFLSFIFSYIIASDIMVKMFYQNIFIRKLVERIRYKQAISS